MRQDKHSIPRRPVERLDPDPGRGLTAEQVRARAAAGWRNDPDDGLTKTAGQIVRDNLCTFFNLLFVLLALCLFLVGAYRDMLFLVIVVLNVLIGIIQELRVKRTLDQIALVSAQKAVVMRDGARQEVPSDQLVLDDIVLLGPGSQLCADAVVREGHVQVNEALLTGEADLIGKGPGDRLLSGSFLVTGHCAARLDQVGADSYASRITREAKGRKASRSAMLRALDRLLKVIGVTIVPLGVVLFTRSLLLLDLGLSYSVSSTVAALVGMIPEGLYLLVSVALAVSVLNLSREGTLVHELSTIENLARVDVLCLDKTGTLTEETLEAGELIPLGGRTRAETEALLGSFLRAGDAGDNATGRALLDRFGGAGETWSPARTVPFSSERKWSALVQPDGVCWFLGAPELLLGPEGGPCREQLAPLLAAGRRALVLARGQGLLDGADHLLGAPEPVALAVLDHCLRPEAAETLRYFRAQGVAVKVISGDSARSVAEVARRAGVEGAERWIDLSALPPEADLSAAAQSNTVFGRVTPRQKRSLIQALRQQGHTVAMIGDGVNDVLALKEADCSVALASGSEAAQHVAQLVLLRSDFAALPHIVREGRRVIHNIQRSAVLFLSKNIFSFLISLILLFLAVPYPLVPAQISLVSALMIGAPSFLLTFEPACPPVRGGFLRTVLLNALPGGLTNVIVLLAACLLGTGMGMPLEQLSTVCAILMGFNGLLILLFLCWPLTPLRGAVLLTMGAAFLGAVCFLGPLFQIATLTRSSWVFLGLLALAAPAVHGLLVFLISRVKRLVRAAEAGRGAVRHHSAPSAS